MFFLSPALSKPGGGGLRVSFWDPYPDQLTGWMLYPVRRDEGRRGKVLDEQRQLQMTLSFPREDHTLPVAALSASSLPKAVTKNSKFQPVGI